jgi:hypothetical protein
MPKIIVDLSCGGYKKDGEVVSWLSSNIAHMYDIKKNLLLKAPNFTGYPHGQLFGSAFIEGTAEELKTFLDLFARNYEDEHTQRDVGSIVEAIDRGEQIIRCYRIVWPGRFPEERADSQMFARMAQVILFEQRGSYGHLISERDTFRLHSLWEVTKVILLDTNLHVHYRNDFAMAFSYHELGFEFNEAEDQSARPTGDDYSRLLECVKKIADRFDEKLAWFAAEIERDPRYGKQGIQ